MAREWSVIVDHNDMCTACDGNGTRLGERTGRRDEDGDWERESDRCHECDGGFVRLEHEVSTIAELRGLLDDGAVTNDDVIELVAHLMRECRYAEGEIRRLRGEAGRLGGKVYSWAAE